MFCATRSSDFEAALLHDSRFPLRGNLAQAISSFKTPSKITYRHLTRKEQSRGGVTLTELDRKMPFLAPIHKYLPEDNQPCDLLLFSPICCSQRVHPYRDSAPLTLMPLSKESSRQEPFPAQPPVFSIWKIARSSRADYPPFRPPITPFRLL